MMSSCTVGRENTELVAIISLIVIVSSHVIVVYVCYHETVDASDIKCDSALVISGPTLNFQKSQDFVTKNPKIEQKFPSYTENTRKR